MTKLLAFMFFIGGAVRVWFDWRDTISQADPFRFAPIGQVWFTIHRESFLIIQPIVERYISVWIWEVVISNIFLTPFAPVMFGLALVFWLLAKWKAKRRS